MPFPDQNDEAEPKCRERARLAEYWLIGALIAAGWFQFLWGTLRALVGWLGI